MFFRRAAGSVVAPGFVVSPRPSGAFPKGVCTRLGGFPIPRRKRQRGPRPLLPYECTSKPMKSVELSSRSSCKSARRPSAIAAHHGNRMLSTKSELAEPRQSIAHGQRGSAVVQAATYVRGIHFTSVLLVIEIGRAFPLPVVRARLACRPAAMSLVG